MSIRRAGASDPEEFAIFAKQLCDVRFWLIADRPDKNSGSLLPCLYPEYGLPGGIKHPRNGADTDPGVNPCNHRTLLFFTQY